MKKNSKGPLTKNVTKVLIGFAIGALLGNIYLMFEGDSIIHLIPEAFNTNEEEHDHRRVLEDANIYIENDEEENEMN